MSYKKHYLLVLICIAFIINANTLKHGYVLDDILVYTQNDFVKKGLRGIPDILTTDFFYGFEKTENDLSGGRYRPLTLVMFAIEYALVGENTFINHLINVLLFCVLIALLYRFFKQIIFSGNELPSFIATLFFAIHPIHTEVIANIKSRDEILAFIFLIISLLLFFRFQKLKSKKQLFFSCSLFFLSLLTKESSITFLAVYPLILYFFLKEGLFQSVKKSLLFFIPAAIYLYIRYLVVGFKQEPSAEIMNAPYLWATPIEAFATKVLMLGKYLWLLIFPHPLSYDYSYNQINYITPSSVLFWLSAGAYLFLLVTAIRSFKNRALISFVILYFLITISIISNFFLDIGAPMAERLLFQPSLFICIIFSQIIFYIHNKKNKIAYLFTGIIILFFGYKTITRNAEWKNNDTLFLSDVITCPNSAKTNMNVAVTYLRKGKADNNPELQKELFLKGIEYGEKSLKIYPNFVDGLLNTGVIYFNLNDWENATKLWSKAHQLSPQHPKAKEFTNGLSNEYVKKGYALYEQKKYFPAIEYYLKAIALNNKNIDAWYNLGGNYLLVNDTSKAQFAWEAVLKINPDHSLSKQWLKSISETK
jgi:protein O-mannosyl-transferase